MDKRTITAAVLSLAAAAFLRGLADPSSTVARQWRSDRDAAVSSLDKADQAIVLGLAGATPQPGPSHIHLWVK